MPGMLIAAPERTETRSGAAVSDPDVKDWPVTRSMCAMPVVTWAAISDGRSTGLEPSNSPHASAEIVNPGGTLRPTAGARGVRAEVEVSRFTEKATVHHLTHLKPSPRGQRPCHQDTSSWRCFPPGGRGRERASSRVLHFQLKERKSKPRQPHAPPSRRGPRNSRPIS